MATYYERMLVADIAALKALDIGTTPAIADTIFIAVRNTGDSDPGWYYYDAASTATELLPNIVTPTSGTGRWFLFNGKGKGGVVVSGAPNRAPLFLNEIWTTTGAGSLGGTQVNEVWLGVSLDGAIEASQPSLVTNIAGGGAWFRLV